MPKSPHIDISNVDRCIFEIIKEAKANELELEKASRFAMKFFVENRLSCL